MKMKTKEQIICTGILAVLLSTMLWSGPIEVLPENRIDGDLLKFNETWPETTVLRLAGDDTLSNEFEGPFYYLGPEDQLYFFATKLTPKSECQVKFILFDFYNGDAVNRTKKCNFYIWQDKEGSPGSTVFTRKVDITVAPGLGRIKIDIVDANLTFNKPFWIGRKEETVGFPATIVDDTPTPKTNVFGPDGTTWQNIDFDFFQFALVNYTQEFVTPPSMPSGPSGGKVGEALTFLAAGSTCSGGHSVEYQFDWGDGTTSSWGAAEQNHTYSSTSDFKIKAHARCKINTGVISDWSAAKTVAVTFCKLAVSIDPAGSGTIDKTPDKTSFTYGESVTLTATASTGYLFKRWEGNKINSTGNPITFQTDGDVTVKAVFSNYSVAADFSAEPTAGVVPLTVQFTDQSSGNITDYKWTFGDGGGSSARNPSYTYNQDGLYIVSLEVSGPDGNSKKERKDYIKVATENSPVIAVEPDTLYFNRPTMTILSGSDQFVNIESYLMPIVPQALKFKSYPSGSPSFLQADDYDTLSNVFEGPLKFLKEQYQTYTKATKLTPASTCALKTLIFGLVNDDATPKSKNYNFFVWQNKDGSPGETLLSFTLTVELERGAWFVPINVAEANLTLDQPFWIGSSEETGGYPTILLDSLETPGTNKWSQDRAAWEPFPLDVVQKAVVQYSTAPPTVLTEHLIVHNKGTVQLEVMDIYTNLPWISAISERAFNIEPGGSKTIKVTANTSALSAGRHQGAISIISNDPIQMNFKAPTAIWIESLAPKIEVSPSMVYLKMTKPNSACILSGDLTIKNSGDGTLTGSVNLPIVNWLESLTTASFSAAPNESQKIRIELKPDRAMVDGEFNEMLTVSSNDPDRPVITVPIVYVITAVQDDGRGLPTRFELETNHPNPFNPVTSIAFALPTPEHVTIEVYNALGKKITELVDEDLPAGQHSVIWNAENEASGTYFYQMKAGDFSAKKKCLLLK